MSNCSPRRYRSASRLALIVIVVCIVNIVVSAVITLSIAGQMQLIDAARVGRRISTAQAEVIDARHMLLGSIEIPVEAAGMLLFLIWVYRVSSNAWALQPSGLQYTPRWSVGWFFVPVAGLYVPFLVMRELWQVSTRSSADPGPPAPASAMLGAWWLVGIIYGACHYSAWAIIHGPMRLAHLSDESLRADSLRDYTWGFLVKETIGIVANVLTIAVVVRLTEFQDRRNAQSGALLDGSRTLPVRTSHPSGSD
jgi:hypothetical protein